MPHPTALAAITALVAARDARDVATAVACYEAVPTIVAQPGTVLTGVDAARSSVEGFLALNASFAVSDREILECGDLALHHSAWTLETTDPDGQPLTVTGRTADVLRRQPDGGWLVAIDNPYGASILG